MLRLATQVTTSPTVVAPQLVGHLGHGPHLGATGREQGDDLVLADLLAEAHPGQHLGHGAGGRTARPTRRRPGRRTEQAAGASIAARAPGVLAAEALGVGVRRARGTAWPGRASARGPRRTRGRW